MNDTGTRPFVYRRQMARNGALRVCCPDPRRAVPAHLPTCMNEFVFRFHRRRSRSRGLVFYRLLELAVDHDPVRYSELIATKVKTV